MYYNYLCIKIIYVLQLLMYYNYLCITIISKFLQILNDVRFKVLKVFQGLELVKLFKGFYVFSLRF